MNETKITSTKFYSLLLNKIHQFYDGNGRTCKILFANKWYNKTKHIDKFTLYIKQCYRIL